MKNWRGKLIPQFIPPWQHNKENPSLACTKTCVYIYVQLGYMHPQLIGERPIRNFHATEIATKTPLPLLALSLLKNWFWDFPFALELFSLIARLIEISSNQQKMPLRVEARKIRIKEAAPPSHCELTSSQLIETLWSENWETLSAREMKNVSRRNPKSSMIPPPGKLTNYPRHPLGNRAKRDPNKEKARTLWSTTITTTTKL